MLKNLWSYRIVFSCWDPVANKLKNRIIISSIFLAATPPNLNLKNQPDLRFINLKKSNGVKKNFFKS